MDFPNITLRGKRFITEKIALACNLLNKVYLEYSYTKESLCSSIHVNQCFFLQYKPTLINSFNWNIEKISRTFLSYTSSSDVPSLRKISLRLLKRRYMHKKIEKNSALGCHKLMKKIGVLTKLFYTLGAEGAILYKYAR